MKFNKVLQQGSHGGVFVSREVCSSSIARRQTDLSAPQRTPNKKS